MAKYRPTRKLRPLPPPSLLLYQVRHYDPSSGVTIYSEPPTTLDRATLIEAELKQTFGTHRIRIVAYRPNE